MLAQIRSSFRARYLRFFLLLLAVPGFTSCATKEQPPLISDNTGRESALPWNKQEKWENTGQLGGMAERFQTR